MKHFAFVALAALAVGDSTRLGCSRSSPGACDWTQHGHDFTHSGGTCVPGQPLSRKLAQLTFDPFVPDETASSGGELLTHYQTPLLVDGDLYMLVKSGTYVACDPNGPLRPCGPDAWNSQVWNEARFVWKDGQLTEAWRFESDWKPEPALLAGWEPVFQPATSHGFLYVPGAGGSVHKLDRRSGKELARISPFGDRLDPNIYVAGGIAADLEGNVYYDAIRLDPSNPLNDATGWLVKVSPDGTAKTVTFDTLVPDAPKSTDLCSTSFSGTAPRPWPPVDANGTPWLPTLAPCLSQRPGLNITPAIGLDGTLYTASRAHGARAYAYVVAVHPDLTPKWDTSLRNLLVDGCGVTIPVNTSTENADPYACRAGTTPGVDPATNANPAGMIIDLSTSSPVALPDGTILYGAYTSYNGERGHLFHFSADGQPLGNYDYGWDVTPAYYLHDSTYSILLKDNHYGQGPYLLTSLSADLKTEWSHAATNTKTCSPDRSGNLVCVDDHPNGFEWCVNAPAVDSEGTVYLNSEDGFLYAIGRDGTEKSHLFLNAALGAAYTPVALDAQGRIYALNGGVLTVVGR